MQIGNILSSSSFCPINREHVGNGIKATAVALATLGIVYKNPVLAAVGIGGALLCRSFPFVRQEKEVPPFERIHFEQPPLENLKNIISPLREEVERLGAFSEEGDWSKKMSKFLDKHDLWFENGGFHVKRKHGDPKDDIQTFYALISLAYSCQNDAMVMREVHKVFIRPFVKRVPIQVLQFVYWPFQVALFRASKALMIENRIFDDIGKQNPEGIAAIKIQRAFRRYRSKNKSFLRRYEPYSFPLNMNPPIPQSNAIDKKKAEAWINAHEKGLRKTARKIIQNIRHISFQKFNQKLESSVKSFNDYLDGLPEDQQKFVIIIPSEKIHSSNKWVTDLALPYFKKPPEDVILSDQLDDFKNRHPEVKRFVMLDDAVYSGQQLSGLADSLGNNLRYIIAPYMTDHGSQLLTNNHTWLSQHEKMLTAWGLYKLKYFSEQEMKELATMLKSIREDGSPSRTFTYFDHRIADSVSTYHGILSGSLPSGSHIRFIRETTSPYKS